MSLYVIYLHNGIKCRSLVYSIYNYMSFIRLAAVVLLILFPFKFLYFELYNNRLKINPLISS